MNGIDQHDEIGVIQIRGNVQTWGPKISNLNTRSAFVCRSEHLHDERPEPIITEKNVPYSHDAHAKLAALFHKTLTCANSLPFASMVWQEQAMQGSKE